MADLGMILTPDPSRVVEGLRDTGYNFNTAMADLVDNSIAAFATKIHVRILKDPNNNVHVYIADNGCGMDFDGLKNAMRYGSERRANPNSLGKFGLGLKTASTAFCRSLSLLSKMENGEYKKVQWDLDEIAKCNEWRLLTPDYTQEELDILEEVTEGGQGTLVIWDKVDRLLKSYSNNTNLNKAFNKMISDLEFHFSMVYQRYLDPAFKNVPTIELVVNDKVIKPWDPFCTSNQATQVLAEMDPWVQKPDGTKSKMYLKAYLLPRIDDFSNKEERISARVSNDFEGFYVYRENRLIYFGNWLGMFVNDPHISLLRVEFSFDSSLDEAFNVDIKKSRILLNEEIFDYIKNTFIPAPRREAENVYRKGTRDKVKKADDGAHSASNNNIDRKAPELEQAQVQVVDEKTNSVKIKNSQGEFSGTIKIINQNENGECRVIPKDDLEANNLWEPAIVEGHHAVLINRNHEYYTKVYAPVLDNANMVTGMDALLWALSEAELATYNENTKDQYEDMRAQVSRILKKLVKDLPDPDLPDNENE